MKKIIIATIIAFFSMFSANVMALYMPEDLYIGDFADLQYKLPVPKNKKECWDMAKSVMPDLTDDGEPSMEAENLIWLCEVLLKKSKVKEMTEYSIMFLSDLLSAGVLDNEMAELTKNDRHTIYGMPELVFWAVVTKPREVREVICFYTAREWAYYIAMRAFKAYGDISQRDAALKAGEVSKEMERVLEELEY